MAKSIIVKGYCYTLVNDSVLVTDNRERVNADQLRRKLIEGMK